MRKKHILIIFLIMISFCAIILSGCFNDTPVEQLKNDYGIIVDGGSFESGTVLVSNEINVTSEEGQNILDIISDKLFNEEKTYIYNIYASKDNKKVQPNGKITVTIPIPNVNIKEYIIFHIKENSAIEELSPTYKENNLVIEIDSFSYFIICEKEHTHTFSEWTPDQTTENKHVRECKCGEVETGECTFDEGKVTLNPSHYEEGIKTYTCKVCGREKEEPIEKTTEHSFSEWTPDQTTENKHVRECKCGEVETGECTFDEGKVTLNPSHYEEGIKTYTCTVCGREKEEPIEKTTEHSFSEWTPDQTTENKHVRECKCGEIETGECTFDEGTTNSENSLIIYTCTVCGREKEELIEEENGIIIVIAGGTATFVGKDTTTSNSNLYGENVNVYLAQINDVLNVTLNDQEGRIFKYWASANGTIIPDEDFSMLVLRGGYYYPVFEDCDTNDYSNRIKIFEGNCEEGILYMSTNSNGDIKYELETINGGHHEFNGSEPFNNQYHKYICTVCGEVVYEEHEKMSSEIIKPAGHAEEGQIQYECYCEHKWIENLPITDDHTIDYDDWHIILASENGEYGKYRVYCKYCEYYEEYWYLNEDINLIDYMENKMIHYQATYGGKVTHDEYYFSYTNEFNQKVYIWALQYEYEYSTNADYNDTYIFMYIDDEDSKTIEPIYLSKSKGDRRSEYLWSIYGYAYDVNGWIELLDYPDDNIGCNNGMLLGNSMSGRASVFYSYHNYWAEIYNDLRIPTTKEYSDLSGTPWEIYYEGKGLTNYYIDENNEYVETGGIDVITYVKDADTSYKKYIYVDKTTGITYGYDDLGTYYRTSYMMRTCKTIVSPEEFSKLDLAGQSVVYSYGDIEQEIKKLCSKRTSFNNFTLTIPQTINAFRFLLSDPIGAVELSGNNTSVYYNTAHVYDSGSSLTLTWIGEEGLEFDCYEIWDFVSQKWIVLSDSPIYTFNTLENPYRDAAYVRVVCHEVDIPVEPSETYRVSVENGYIEIDGVVYNETIEVPSNTFIYVFANEVEGKNQEYWVDQNGVEYYQTGFTITSDLYLTPVYVDAIYNVYVSGWNYDSYISINDGDDYYTDEFEGNVGDVFELNTKSIPDSDCNIFIGWYLETYVSDSLEYILICETQNFTYEIKGDIYGQIYAVWTAGDNPFIKKYVDIRATNGFVMYSGGEAGDRLDNAYSAISLSNMGRVRFYDNPTDEKYYSYWDIAYRYELEGEVIHDFTESYEDEYDYYPAEYWVSDPQYNYPDGVINVTGIDNPYEEIETIE